MESNNIYISYDRSNRNCLSDPCKFRKSFLFSKNQVFQMNVDDDSEIPTNNPKPFLMTYIETTTQELNKISNLNLDI